MAYRVVFDEMASADFEEIIAYLNCVLKNRDAAEHFMDEVLNVVYELENTPGVFPLVKDDRLGSKGYRKRLFMNFVILYKIHAEDVHVVRIFHQSQDYGRLV